MTDRTSDQNPDSRPRDDDRGSMENIDRPTNGDTSPDALNGAVGGTDGVTKNQGDDAQ